MEQRNSEIEQFLCDVREHFRSSLETSEYENTSNLFHVTEAEATAKLLHRCELLLQQYCGNKKLQQQQQQQQEDSNNTSQLVNGVNGSLKLNGLPQNPHDGKEEEVSYLDMTANNKIKTGSNEYMDFNTSADSDKTFRCSTRLADICDGKLATVEQDDTVTMSDIKDNESFDEETQIYDICQVSQADIDTLQKSCLTSHETESNANDDCPYMNLPAGHLAIQKSSKYGQLQRIEKRLFFDQSKKCYCGILNDWLLCYADGPTSSRPSTTLHLRASGIEIEHSGEGKRREICFQITTGDPNKKFIFQANNEVDAKEWIHAIETAIRSDPKLPRKLPTPPVIKKITFVGHSSRCNGNSNGSVISATIEAHTASDCIYEEPSPVYDAHTPNELLIGKPPELPEKVSNPIAIAKRYEYDVPKCPAQPIASQEQLSLKMESTTTQGLIENETMGLLNNNTTEGGAISSSKSFKSSEQAEKTDFQTKVKDLHNKLSSQLLTVASPTHADRLLKKTARKTYSNSSTESETIAFALSTSPTAKDQKKQKKSNSLNNSPQKGTTNCLNGNSTSEKSAKNWFLNRLNKTTGSIRSSTVPAPSTKCRQSEKENLLNSLDIAENFECSSNPSSPILKNGNSTSSNCNNNNNKSKVNMIINQFEASGGLAMFSMEAISSLSSAFCDNDCNNYEPIMTVSVAPTSLLKKV